MITLIYLFSGQTLRPCVLGEDEVGAGWSDRQRDSSQRLWGQFGNHENDDDDDRDDDDDYDDEVLTIVANHLFH